MRVGGDGRSDGLGVYVLVRISIQTHGTASTTHCLYIPPRVDEQAGENEAGPCKLEALAAEVRITTGR